MSFHISLEELEATADKVAKLNKRAAKAGIPATATLTEVGREVRSETTEFGLVRSWTVVEAEITGVGDVRFNGWTLAAVVDHDEAGNIFRSVPGFEVEIPEEFRTTDRTRCDHCNMVRTRNQTVLVWSETEGFKQVGSDCVKLFLGVSVATLIAWTKDVNDFEGEGGSWGRVDVTVTEFVAAAALVTETYGFKPAQFEGASTKSVALSLAFLTSKTASEFFKMNPELKNPTEKMLDRVNTLATEAVAWVATQGGSEYMTNLRLAAARNELGRNGGLLASLPNTYKRAMGVAAEKAAAKAAKVDEFVGTVGEKVTFKATVAYTNRSESYSYYGPEGLFVILAAETGHTFYLNTTVETAVGMAFEDADRTTVFTVTGTVKTHKTNGKGEKVTVLTRCKATEG